MTHPKVFENDGITQLTATSGQTVFDSDYLALENNDFAVYSTRDGVTTQLTLSTDYTVSNLRDEDGFTVTINSGATEDDLITLYRNVPVARLIDYSDGGDFRADTINDDIDRVVMMIQDLRRDIDRGFKLEVQDTATSCALQIPTDRAGKLFGWDESGCAKAYMPVEVAAASLDDEVIIPVGGVDGADWNADGRKLTGLEDGTTDTDAVTYGQFLAERTTTQTTINTSIEERTVQWVVRSAAGTQTIATTSPVETDIEFNVAGSGDATLYDNSEPGFVIPAALDGAMVEFSAVFGGTSNAAGIDRVGLRMLVDGAFAAGLPAQDCYEFDDGATVQFVANLTSGPVVVSDGEVYSFAVEPSADASNNITVDSYSWFAMRVISKNPTGA